MALGAAFSRPLSELLPLRPLVLRLLGGIDVASPAADLWHLMLPLLMLRLLYGTRCRFITAALWRLMLLPLAGLLDGHRCCLFCGGFLAFDAAAEAAAA